MYKRYSYYGQNNHVCVKHRYNSKYWGKCPVCQEELTSIGYRWRIPKKNNAKGWKVIAQKVKAIHEWRKANAQR